MHFRTVFYYLGWILFVEAIAFMLPMIIAIVSGEGTWPYFIISAALSGGLGFLFNRIGSKNGEFYVREGYAVTAIGWILLSLIGALPFRLSGRIPFFIDALFETVSGFTTTGSSILTDVEALGKGLLFWRSFSHWLGGMGVLVFILAILPSGSGYSMQIMRAESPGPDVSKFVPKVTDTAKVLYLIYILMTVLMILSYLISGMPLFDAVCIGVGTAGTGGFAIRNTGMGDYNTVSQSLITIWMILFGVNFNVYYLFLNKKFKEALKSEEVRVYFGIIIVSLILLTLTTYFANYRSEGLYYSFHHSAFTVGAIITTTGFGTVDFSEWPEFSKLIILILMFVGACAGSTGGGMKVSRYIILFKQAKKELHMLIHPQAVRLVRFEGKPVEHSVQRSLNNYCIMYLFIFVLSLLIVSINGYDFMTSFSAVASAMNNIGPGLTKMIGPVGSFANFSTASKIVFIFDMLAGRLELLPMILLFYPRTWTRHY